MPRSKKKKVVRQARVRLPEPVEVESREINPFPGFDVKPSFADQVRIEVYKALKERETPQINDIEKAMTSLGGAPQAVTFLESVNNNINSLCARIHEAGLIMRNFNTDRLGASPTAGGDNTKSPEPNCAAARIWNSLDTASSLLTLLEAEIKRAQEL